jgi:hypothetical protein
MLCDDTSDQGAGVQSVLRLASTKNREEITLEGGFLKRLWKLSAGSSSSPIQLNLEPPKAAPEQPRQPRPVSSPNQGERVPGNFYRFEMFLQVPIDGTVHIGSPKVPIRDARSGEVSWASKLEHLYPGPNSVQIPWIDHPERGISAREIRKPEDILGAEGRLGEHRFRFERILELGRSVVVYALLNPDKQMRMAYGFNREAVEPGYVNPSIAEIQARASKLQNTDPEQKAPIHPRPPQS